MIEIKGMKPMGEIKVKQLKWLNYRASSVLGLYQIVHDGAAFYVNNGDEYRIPGRFATSKEAADAAQADFEARILSALTLEA